MNEEVTDKKYYSRLDTCISRFKNGRERYHNSITLRTAIEVLMMGGDPYEIIDMLCQQNDDLAERFKDYVNRDTRPMLLVPNNPLDKL